MRSLPPSSRSVPRNEHPGISPEPLTCVSRLSHDAITPLHSGLDHTLLFASAQFSIQVTLKGRLRNTVCSHAKIEPAVGIQPTLRWRASHRYVPVHQAGEIYFTVGAFSYRRTPIIENTTKPSFCSKSVRYEIFPSIERPV